MVPPTRTCSWVSGLRSENRDRTPVSSASAKSCTMPTRAVGLRHAFDASLFFSPYVALLDIALVFLIFRGDVKLY